MQEAEAGKVPCGADAIFGYSSAITSSCFHIHENKKLGGSTIC